VSEVQQELQAEASALSEHLILNIPPNMHAEDAIVQYANDIGVRIYSIAVIGPAAICGSCTNVLDPIFKVYIPLVR
jgi:hypothetical protein